MVMHDNLKIREWSLVRALARVKVNSHGQKQRMDKVRVNRVVRVRNWTE